MRFIFFLSIIVYANTLSLSRIRVKFNNRQHVQMTQISGVFRNDDNVLTVGKDINKFRKWPCGDNFDKQILSLWLPAILNYIMYPLVGAVDTYFVGKMNDVSALAGQGAANQVFNSAYFIMSFLPSVVSPLVAQAMGASDEEQAQQRVGEAMLLCTIIGTIGTALLLIFSDKALGLVLSPTAPAFAYAKQYLVYRAWTILPALLSTVAFAAYRGRQDIMMPLKISFISNMVNIILDPLFIFTGGMGVAGAAAASCIAELVSFFMYVADMMRMKIITTKSMQFPRWAMVKFMMLGGLAVQVRALAIEFAFLAVSRAAQASDITGTAAAAHTISMQLWQLGSVIILGLNTVGSILIPAEVAKVKKIEAAADQTLLRAVGGADGRAGAVGERDTVAAEGIPREEVVVGSPVMSLSVPTSTALRDNASAGQIFDLGQQRTSEEQPLIGSALVCEDGNNFSSEKSCNPEVTAIAAVGAACVEEGTLGVSNTVSPSLWDVRAQASRLLRWGFCLGSCLAVAQLLAVPLLGVFSSNESVRQQARVPAAIAAVLQLINGMVFVGEGIQQGNQCFTSLALVTAVATVAMVSSLHFIGGSLTGVWISMACFYCVRLLGVVIHHRFTGPLSPPSIRALERRAEKN